MCNKKNLANRVEKASAAVFFSKVEKREKDGRAKVFIVPGSQAKQYQVILRRFVDSETNLQAMSVEVNLLTGNGTLPLHTPTISYHGMCAVQITAAEANYKVIWCANPEDAQKLSRIGGALFSVSKWKNPTIKMWGVMRKTEKE